MSKHTYIKVSGVWKTITHIWRKVGGSWHDRTVSWINIDDFWKDCMTYAPLAPTMVGISEPIMGDYLRATWTNSSGETGYILQRKPWWTGVAWQDTWTTVYTGVDTRYDDHVDADNPDDGQQFDYHVCAYNDDGESDYSSLISFNWIAS
jgi:hypothetical protein